MIGKIKNIFLPPLVWKKMDKQIHKHTKNQQLFFWSIYSKTLTALGIKHTSILSISLSFPQLPSNSISLCTFVIKFYFHISSTISISRTPKKVLPNETPQWQILARSNFDYPKNRVSIATLPRVLITNLKNVEIKLSRKMYTHELYKILQ